jgi:hypothetical protein
VGRGQGLGAGFRRDVENCQKMRRLHLSAARCWAVVARLIDFQIYLSIFPAKRNEQKTSKYVIEGHTLSEQLACREIKKQPGVQIISSAFPR